MATLDDLRKHLDDIDRQLIELIADRQRTSREIARVKRATGYAPAITVVSVKLFSALVPRLRLRASRQRSPRT